MPVETYECPETAAEPAEMTQEAVKLIEELGLTGQQSIVGDTAGGTKSRCPYKEATEDQLAVFGILCPSKWDVEKYTRCPIPLRVLQVLSHAKSLGLFDEFQVWDRRDQKVKDPVLVGLAKDPESTWRKTTYLLARWGEHLDEWPAMVKQAAEAKYKECMTDLRKKLQTVKQKIEELEHMPLTDMPLDYSTYV